MVKKAIRATIAIRNHQLTILLYFCPEWRKWEAYRTTRGRLAIARFCKIGMNIYWETAQKELSNGIGIQKTLD